MPHIERKSRFWADVPGTGTLRAGETVGGPTEGVPICTEDGVLLLHPEPGLLSVYHLHHLLTGHTMVCFYKQKLNSSKCADIYSSGLFSGCSSCLLWSTPIEDTERTCQLHTGQSQSALAKDWTQILLTASRQCCATHWSPTITEVQ